MKKAIVTGATGQDGAYLCELLLNKGYQVWGTYRRSSTANHWRLNELNILSHPQFNLVEYDLIDLGSAISLISSVRPTEIYNLAAQSFVGVSFKQPVGTAHIDALGPLNLLEAIRLFDRKIKFYQASTSEMFGKVQAIPQNETTPFYPRSPYAVAKLFAHWSTVNYRESYDLFATSGILFNHESPLRGKEFVTRKITDTLAAISLGKERKLELGNLDAKRDWGYAKDYVYGMWQMMQVDTPDTYVLSTNRTETVRFFVEKAGEALGFNIIWEGEAENEIGFDKTSGRILVQVNKEFYRPAEVDLLIGSFDKARRDFGWSPNTNIESLCAMMVDADIIRNRNGFSF